MIKTMQYNTEFGLHNDNMLEKNIFHTNEFNATDSLSSFILYGASNSSLLPRWWSEERDAHLHKASLEVDLLSSVINILMMKLFNLPLQVIAKNNMITSHTRLANTYNLLIQQAWQKYGETFIRDMLVSDKGAFFIVDSDRSPSRPLGMNDIPLGLKHISSRDILLNDNATYPFIWSRNNTNIKLHHTRVIHIAQMPVRVSENVIIGYSFASRAYNAAQLLAYAMQYGLEALGALDSDQIIYGTGTTSKAIKQAFKDTQVESMNTGRLQSGKRVYLGLRDPSGKLGTLNLKRLPDGFDYDKWTRTTYSLLAVAGGVDVDDIAPSSNAGTTKTATLISEQKSKFKLVSWFSTKLAGAIGQKFLPAILQLRIGSETDNVSESKGKALINLARISRIQFDIGVTDVREARVNAQRNGSITPEQFRRLELSDGRLADGLPVKALFLSKDEVVQNLLKIENYDTPYIINPEIAQDILPLLEDKIRIVEATAVNTTSANIHQHALNALAALQWLLEEYKSINNSLDSSQDAINASNEVTKNITASTPTSQYKSLRERPTDRTRRKIHAQAKRLVKSVWNTPDKQLKSDELQNIINKTSEQVTEFIDYIHKNRRVHGVKLATIYDKLQPLLP